MFVSRLSDKDEREDILSVGRSRIQLCVLNALVVVALSQRVPAAAGSTIELDNECHYASRKLKLRESTIYIYRDLNRILHPVLGADPKTSHSVVFVEMLSAQRCTLK